jgi:anti-sigma regulatory factor (Ser/Thr protein kinase)
VIVRCPSRRAARDPARGTCTRTLAVRGRTDELRTAADGIVAHIADALGPPGRREDAVLAVHEVLANALEHGHLGDPRVPIVVEVERSVTAALVRITDRARRGPWVGPRAGHAPSAWATRGRGWRLVEGGCDRAEVGPGDRDGATTIVELTWWA